MELLFKMVPFAMAGWNAIINKILKWRKVHSEKVVDAIYYYSMALSLMGFFDVKTLKELIELKGAA